MKALHSGILCATEVEQAYLYFIVLLDQAVLLWAAFP